MKAKFKKFLTDNGAYRKFVRNLKDYRDMSFDEYCDKAEKWDKIIISAYHWFKSNESMPFGTEGFSYWHKLHIKWLKLLEND